MKKEDLNFLDSLLKQRPDPKKVGLTNIIKNKYNKELEDFDYIHDLEEFKKLTKGGIIKPVNLQQEELKKGGILVKIEEEDDKWYALIGILNRKIFWRVYFDRNYIYYRRPYPTYIRDDRTIRFTNTMDYFIPANQLHKYDEQARPNKLVDDLYKSYVIKEKK